MFFTHKLLAFGTFCFEVIVQLLHFSVVVFLTHNSFHRFEGSIRCWVELFRLGASQYLVDPENRPDFIDYSYLQSIWLSISSFYGWQNQFLSKVISHFKICWFDSLLSCKMAFAFEWQASRINASAFKGHLLDFNRVECTFGNVYVSLSVIIHFYMLGFHRWLFVIFTLSCMVHNTITFFLSLFFLSI